MFRVVLEGKFSNGFVATGVGQSRGSVRDAAMKALGDLFAKYPGGPASDGIESFEASARVEDSNRPPHRPVNFGSLSPADKLLLMRDVADSEARSKVSLEKSRAKGGA
jgi:hypothetical protein